MNLARRVAEMIAEKVRYPNGDSVACALPEACIGGLAESVKCEDQFRQDNVGVSLITTPRWYYCSETVDMDPLRPEAVFALYGTERPGAVYLAAVLAGHLGHLFVTLASILRIPVYMHNVAADRIFRPSTWKAFGTENLEATNFRACQNFGPLYGRT